MAQHKKIQLILEKEGRKLWGRVSVCDNVIFDSAATIQALKKKMRRALADFEDLKTVEFEYAYDLTVFFEKFNFLNQSKIAEMAGISPGLIRQYSSGHKQPSKEQVGKIQTAVRKMATQLSLVELTTKGQ